MQNRYLISCTSCKTENELFRLNCKQCTSILQNRQPNIDFWNVSGKMFISPTEAFMEIIRSEHKNFVFLLLGLLTIRIMSFTGFFTSYALKVNVPFIHSVFFIPIFLLCVYILVLGLSRLPSLRSIEIRTADIYAALSFAQIPLIISGIFLFLLEYIFFGDYLFLTSPNVFMINPAAAWMFIALEAFCFLWMLFNSYLVFKIYLNNKLLSFLLPILLYVLMFAVYFTSLLIYVN